MGNDLAIKNNNPGNIRVPGTNEFQKFDNLQAGFDALLKQIKMYQDGSSKNTTGKETLLELMKIYAPASDKNDPDGYAKYLAEKLNISINTPISQINTNKLALAIASKESKQAYDALKADATINTGVLQSDGGDFVFTSSPQVIELNKYQESTKEYYSTIQYPDGAKDYYWTKKPVVEKQIYGEQYLVESGGKTAVRVSEQKYENPTVIKVKIEEIAPLTKDGKSAMTPSVMVKEGPGKGYYLTKVNNGDGRMTPILSKVPLEEKVVYGDKLYSEVGTDNSYSVAKNADGKWASKLIDDKKIATNKLAELAKKAKTKEGLTNNEMIYATKAFQVRKMELNTEKAKARTTEGTFENSRESGVRNAAGIQAELDNTEKLYYTQIAVPELKKRQKESRTQKDLAIKEARESYTNGKITKQQLDAYQKTYDELLVKDRDLSTNLTKWSAPKTTDYYDWKLNKTLDNYEGDVALDKEHFFAGESFGGYKHEYSTPIDEALNALNAFVPEKSKTNVAGSQKPVIGGNVSAGGAGSSSTSSASTTPTTTEAGKGINDPDPSGMVGEEAKTKPELAAYLDEDYLIKQNKLDQETIDFIKSQKEFNAELPAEEYDYKNLLGNIADVGKGIIGVAGAMQDVPEYQRGDMFKESMDDARRMKDMGLSEQEKGFMKQNAERAYGFATANLRGLSGGSAAAALGGSGEAQRILQGNYGEMAALDQGVRRQNRAAFAQAAVQDEAVNRKIFEDKMNQVMANKAEGAALARDAYTNMNERAQFNQQYGKGSQYQQYMNEQILSQRQAREALTQSQAFQKQQAIQSSQSNIDSRNAEIKKYNEGR